MNPKGDLIARLLALNLGTPTFEAESSGPAHERIFRVSVIVSGRPLGAGGEGRSKKDAERAAAEAALRALDAGGDVETADTAVGVPGERWPIYAGVLQGALDAALEFAPDDATLEDVRRDAVQFYRDLLADLGHGPEDE